MKNINHERLYRKGFEEGKKVINRKSRAVGQADVLDNLQSVKGIGPKLYRRILEHFRKSIDLPVSL